MRKFIFLLCVVFLISLLIFNSCGGDDEDDLINGGGDENKENEFNPKDTIQSLKIANVEYKWNYSKYIIDNTNFQIQMQTSDYNPDFFVDIKFEDININELKQGDNLIKKIDNVFIRKTAGNSVRYCDNYKINSDWGIYVVYVDTKNEIIYLNFNMYFLDRNGSNGEKFIGVKSFNKEIN